MYVNQSQGISPLHRESAARTSLCSSTVREVTKTGVRYRGNSLYTLNLFQVWPLDQQLKHHLDTY